MLLVIHLYSCGNRDRLKHKILAGILAGILRYPSFTTISSNMTKWAHAGCMASICFALSQPCRPVPCPCSKVLSCSAEGKIWSWPCGVARGQLVGDTGQLRLWSTCTCPPRPHWWVAAELGWPVLERLQASSATLLNSHSLTPHSLPAGLQMGMSASLLLISHISRHCYVYFTIQLQFQNTSFTPALDRLGQYRHLV